MGLQSLQENAASKQYARMRMGVVCVCMRLFSRIPRPLMRVILADR